MAKLIVLITVCLFSQVDLYDSAELDWELKRQQLVELLRTNGVWSKPVLSAINSVPRHHFVPKPYREYSYINRPLPIGNEQTISQPEIVALMCQEAYLKATDRVLKIGTGSGYHAAVMSLLVNSVYTIEIIPELGNKASGLLDSLGFDNVIVRIGDGYIGWAEHAPYDAIILTAAPPEIPKPLLEQLKVGGRLIAPVGEDMQVLVRVIRTESGYDSEELMGVRFVPMTGKAERKLSKP